LAAGAAEVGFAYSTGRTRLVHLYEQDPLRVLFPAAEPGEPPLAALVMTSGGLLGGDRLDIGVHLGPLAAVHVTAAAAEKVYRSLGPATVVRQTLAVGAGGALEFLPPETILFDGARLNRETVVELAPGAAFLGGDLVVFGRRARGEGFTRGSLRDVWEVRRDGVLVWGDALDLGDDVAAAIADPAGFDRAAAFAMLILAPGRGRAEAFVAGARAVQEAAPRGVRAGVTALGGLAVARWLAADPLALRCAYAALAGHWRAAALGLPPHLPRLWHV
jgi:urease accessory protein